MAEEELPPETEAPPATEPEWARSLRQSITELPGKLVATITDDDKSGIAEAVHGLFERSGAFKPEEEEREAEKEAETTDRETETTATEAAPKKGGRFSGFARRFAGE